jgi:hypothetical protein
MNKENAQAQFVVWFAFIRYHHALFHICSTSGSFVLIASSTRSGGMNVARRFNAGSA